MKATVSLRQEGRAVEALLILLKHLTAHARWVFALLLVLYGLSGLRIVEPQEQAILLRFGRLQPHVHGPGLLVGLPEPFDRLIRFETGKDLTLTLDHWQRDRVKISDPDQPIQFSDAEMAEKVRHSKAGGSVHTEYANIEGVALDPVTRGYSVTADFNVVQGRFALRYRIADPFRYASSGDRIELLLEKLVYRAMTRQLAQRRIDESLTQERRELAMAAAVEVQQQADLLGLGVTVSAVEIIELSPPSQVLAAFEDVTNAKQFAKTLFENAREYDATTQAESEAEASGILSRARGYTEELIASARGEASSFSALVANYRIQPDLVANRLLRETLDTVMARTRSRTLMPMDQARPSMILEPAPDYAR